MVHALSPSSDEQGFRSRCEALVIPPVIKINATEINAPDVQCLADGTYCAVVKPFDSKLTTGLIYFITHKPEVSFPFVKVSTTSANAPVIYSPPKKANDGKATLATASKTLAPADTLQLLMKKEQFSIQGFK